MTGQTEESHLINALYTEDLIINRNGNLSETQKRSLRLLVIFWFGVAGVDIGFLVFLGYFQLRYQIEGFGYLLLCALSIIAARYCILSALPLQEDIKNDEVKSISGKIFKRLSFTSNNRSSIDVIGNKI